MPLKVCEWSSIIDNGFMIFEIIEEINEKYPDPKPLEYVPMKFIDLICKLRDICLKNAKGKKIHEEKEKRINEFLKFFCKILPDIVVIGPIIPCEHVDSDLVRELIKKFPHFHAEFVKHHKLEVWRPNHQVEFIFSYQQIENDLKKDLLKQGVKLLPEINESMTHNRIILQNYFKEVSIPKVLVNN